jgi:hypothetical protein
MANEKITIADDGAGNLSVATQSDMTLTDTLIAGVLSPLKGFSDSTTYYNEKQVGQMTLVTGLGGFVGGDMFGHRVPVLGQRRG